MDILFIHGNYPAQFRNLAPLLGKNGNRVIFMTERRDADDDAQDGIEIHRFSSHRIPGNQTHHYLMATEEAVLKGQAVLREIVKLTEKGFIPRIVITHAGMGYGLFIKDVLPNTIHIGYFEWYFRPETTKNIIRNFDLDAQLKSGLRNLPIIQELNQCDTGVVPTKWQKSQFPHEYQDKLNIIFDGIDTNFFYPHTEKEKLENIDISIENRQTHEKFILGKHKKILSYATRGMEPLRGFPEFMRAVPALLKENHDLNVLIAGADRRAYSYDAPTNKGSWKQHMLTEIGEFEGKERIIFTGLLDYKDYRMLLWRTNLHCYLTKPYVTSWSLFEAAACGARLAVNRSPATEDIAIDETVTWLELEKPHKLEESLRISITNNNAKQCKIKAGYELAESLRKWELLLNNLLDR